MRRHRFNAILVSLVVDGFVTVDLSVALAAQQNCEPDGDLNRDGEVTAVDALMAFSHALNMTTLDACQEMIGDVFPSPASPDGAFTAADALCIYARAHGRPSCLDALVEEVGRGDLIARVVDETDPELPGYLDLLELAVYSSTATGVIFEITTRERYRAGQFYRLHFDTDEPFWSDWSQDYDFSWGVDVEAERNGIWSTGPTTPELLALDGNRLTLLADIGEGFSASVIAGVGPIDGEWIQSNTSESGVVDVVGDGETAAQAFPRHGVGTFFSYVVNDHADPDDDPFQLSYQVTGRDAYRGREVSVVKVSGRFVDPAHNYDYTDLWDAESGNTVVSDLDSDHEIQYTPHLGWMSFPMKVGKDWRATYTERHTSTSETCVDSADRSLEPVCETVKHTEEEVVWADLEVVAYEAVTVPAGTFMAFRVTLTDSSCDADPDCIWDSGSYWYAPEVGYFVKLAILDHTFTIELTDWELVPEPEVPGPVVEGPVLHDVGTSWLFDFTNRHTGMQGTYGLTVQGRRQHRGRQVLAVSRATNLDIYPESSPFHGCDTELWDAETGGLVACLRGGQVQVEFLPYYGNFKFPMELGNTWLTTYEYIDHVNDFTGEFWQEFRVFAYEEITVNGATFMAYGVMNTDSNVDRYYETYWYAPEIDMIVKADFGGVEIEVDGGACDFSTECADQSGSEPVEPPRFVFGDQVSEEDQARFEDTTHLVMQYLLDETGVVVSDYTVFVFRGDLEDFLGAYIELRGVPERYQAEVREGVASSQEGKRFISVDYMAPSDTMGIFVYGDWDYSDEGSLIRTMSHEYFHVVQRHGITESNRGPTWLEEGSAVYAETKTTVWAGFGNYADTKSWMAGEAAKLDAPLQSLESVP